MSDINPKNADAASKFTSPLEERMALLTHRQTRLVVALAEFDRPATAREIAELVGIKPHTASEALKMISWLEKIDETIRPFGKAAKPYVLPSDLGGWIRSGGFERFAKSQVKPKRSSKKIRLSILTPQQRQLVNVLAESAEPMSARELGESIGVRSAHARVQLNLIDWLERVECRLNGRNANLYVVPVSMKRWMRKNSISVEDTTNAAITIRMPKELHEAIRKSANDSNTTMTTVVINMLVENFPSCQMFYRY